MTIRRESAEDFGSQEPSVKHRQCVIRDVRHQFFCIEHFVRVVVPEHGIDDQMGRNGRQGHAAHLGIACRRATGVRLCAKVLTVCRAVSCPQGRAVHRQQTQSFEQVRVLILAAPCPRRSLE